MSVLEAGIHAETPRRSEGVSSVSGEKDIMVPEFVGEKGLQFPFTDVDDANVFFNLLPVTGLEHRGDELSWRVDFSEVDEGLVVGDLKDKGAGLIWMID